MDIRNKKTRESIIEFLKFKIEKNKKEIISINKKLRKKINLQEENEKLNTYIDSLINYDSQGA